MARKLPTIEVEVRIRQAAPPTPAQREAWNRLFGKVFALAQAAQEAQCQAAKAEGEGGGE